MKTKRPKCTECEFWVFTKTLRSPDSPGWHCESGFKPKITDWYNCQEMAAGNRRSMERLKLLEKELKKRLYNQLVNPSH